MFFNEKPIFVFRGPFGIEVQIMPSIAMLILIFVGLGGLGDIVGSLIFVSVILGSIFLHELGHGWGCYIQGVPVRRIALHGAGGFCEPKRSTSTHEDELIVAMGPIVTALLWIIPTWLAGQTSGMMSWVFYLTGTLNFYFLIFNMLPVFPLDGGRLFHLALIRFLPGRTATRIAGGVGLLFCVIWIPAAIYGFIVLGFILFFIPSFQLHLQMLRA